MEQLLKRELEEQGYYVMRSAGSKGRYDLCAVHTFWDDSPPLLIQVKGLKTPTGTTALCRAFRKDALPRSPHYQQSLYVRRKGAWIIFDA